MQGFYAVCAVCVIVIASAAAAPEDLTLVFEDTFDKFDRCKWQQEVTMWGGGNGEFETYSTDPANTYVRDNTLFIKPTLTKDNINPSTKQPFGEDFLHSGVMDLVAMYGRCTMVMNFGCFREGKYGILPVTMSGRIRSKERFSFRFGRMEVIAKMPVGDWLWPAIWLLPEDNIYGGWPRSGEIDLVEARGNRDLRDAGGTAIGIQQMGSALHWGPRWDINKYPLTVAAKHNFSSHYGEGFHKYTLDWDENGLRFSVDDDEYFHVPNPLINQNQNWTGFYDFAMDNGGIGGMDNPWVNGTLMAPFDQKFHIIMNVAVGGTGGYFPDDVTNNGNGSKPWSNSGGGNKMEEFWSKRNDWYPTWQGEDAALQVKSVRVYQKTEHLPTSPQPMTSQPPGEAAPVYPDMDMVFEDTFDKFDKCKWDHEITMWGGGNGEFQTYTQDPVNSYVRDNTLFIKPTLTMDNVNPATNQRYGEAFLRTGKIDLVEMYGKCTQSMNFGCTREGQYGILPVTMSGRIRTLERFSFRYGKMEVVAKMPAGDWLWPAIWLLPEDNVYGGWPRSGEIDLVEVKGNHDLRDSSGGHIGIQQMGSALHWGPRWNVNKYDLTHDTRKNFTNNYAEYFHKYTLDWNENGIRFSVDEAEVFRFPDPPVNENRNWTGFWNYGKEHGGGMSGLDNPWCGESAMAPFDQKFHIIMNVAVGGTGGYFPDDVTNNGNGSKPWSNSGGGNKMEEFWSKRDDWYPTWQGEDAALQVKSVRVYQRKASSTPPAPTNPSGGGGGGPVASADSLKQSLLALCYLSTLIASLNSLLCV